MATGELLEELELRPISRTEYEALGRLGVFDDEKVELLEGRAARLRLRAAQPHPHRGHPGGRGTGAGRQPFA